MKILLILYLFPLFLIGCSSSSDLPAINNADQLAMDCDLLIQKSTTDTIDSEQWPESIKALKPVTVKRDGKAIFITTYADTGVGARGYAVSREKPQDSNHYVISTTSYKDIYRFDLKP